MLIYEGENRMKPLLTKFVTEVTKCVNTCATSYITVDNSRPISNVTLKVKCDWKNKDWYIEKWCLFYSRNNCTLFKQLPKHVVIFLILRTFNRLPRLNGKRCVGSCCEWNTFNNSVHLKNAIRYGPSVTVYALWPFVSNKYG
jgi:hypothetical protein